MFWITLDHGIITKCNWKSNKEPYNNVLRLHQYQDSKTLLFDAVLQGNTIKVKQLVSSGIDKNTVIHSPVKWEGATILGTAAYEGHFEIVRFLVESGTSVNFIDPCIGRNSLHWACMGNQYKIAKFLIENGAAVNHTDKDLVTPLIQASLCQNLDLVRLLIHHGADANLVDRLQCSPLHYACMYRNPALVEIIIKSGCVLNNHSSLAKGTPLSNIVINMDMQNCSLLLNAGYNLRGDSWFEQSKKCHDHRIQTLIDYQKTIKSLKNLCRINVRRQLLKGVKIEQTINSLEIPNNLKHFLNMKEV
ncbi:ankyrin repeat and SOCS box protein 11-like isoform X1 [Mytilus trossulus]|uniref:ankyrin repeat and SOCS box protein 11-like isoform X1 n=1 Tax=Mytilus trossulus TaxID=6551 RepID=UPI0030058897